MESCQAIVEKIALLQHQFRAISSSCSHRTLRCLSGWTAHLDAQVNNYHHSMVYFFHHYELPVILQQAQFQQFLLRNTHHHRAGGVIGGVGGLPTGVGFGVQNPLAARLTQFISVVRSTVTTQTSNTVQQVATSTSTTATSTVGTSAQPITSTHSVQTSPAPVESNAAQVPSEELDVRAIPAASQTHTDIRPAGGSDDTYD